MKGTLKQTGIPACQGGLGRPSWVSGGSRLVALGRVLSPRPPGTLMSPRSPPAKRPTLEKKSDWVRNQFELKTVTVAGAQELKNVCRHCNGNQSAHHVVTRLEDHLVGNKKALGKGCLKFLGRRRKMKRRRRKMRRI